MTAGFTGAELANLVNEAALLAGRKGMTEVGEKEFEDAVLRTVAGIEKKRSLLTAAEKIVVSAHEAGHAVVGTAVGASSRDNSAPSSSPSSREAAARWVSPTSRPGRRIAN